MKDILPLGQENVEGKRKFVDKVLKAGLHEGAVQAYLATTAYVNAQLGRLLTALNDSPHQENTIVVFLSDHGFHLGEKNHWQKATLWEEATHCLLMIRVPGMTKKGSVSERFVSLQDLYPILVELCQLESSDTLDDRSLVPLLKNPDSPWESTAISCLSYKGNPPSAHISIRNESGRFIRYNKEQEEFYDTTKDPREWTNEINKPAYASTIKKIRDSIPAHSEMASLLPVVQRKSKK